ncbi:MAG: glycosyltransferase family 2 protein, partial [Candidatus Aminicenantales bacterium]
SVCIPAFNNERFIDAAIRSVLGQTLDDFELIVIDDHSADGTREKVRAYSDARIRFIENEANLGHEGNWNKALGEARGRFVKILPGDDLLRPRCLERQTAAFKDVSAGAVALVSCARDIIDGEGRTLMRRAFPGKDSSLPGREAVRKSVRAGTNLIGEPAAVLLRADLIALTGAFSAANLYVIDLDYWVRLLLHGRLAVISEPLCGFRVSRAAASTRIRKTQSRDFRRFLRRLGEDPRFGLTAGDLRRGRIRASLNAWMRRLIYRISFSR